VDLRIRDFPNDLGRWLKSSAAEQGISLHDFVVRLMKGVQAESRQEPRPAPDILYSSLDPSIGGAEE